MGVENGVDFQDDSFLRMKWWAIMLCLALQDTDSTLGGSYFSHPQSSPSR